MSDWFVYLPALAFDWSLSHNLLMTGEGEKVHRERDVINLLLFWCFERREHKLFPSNTCVHCVVWRMPYWLLMWLVLLHVEKADRNEIYGGKWLTMIEWMVGNVCRVCGCGWCCRPCVSKSHNTPHTLHKCSLFQMTGRLFSPPSLFLIRYTRLS